jgi:hypothetical protein
MLWFALDESAEAIEDGTQIERGWIYREWKGRAFIITRKDGPAGCRFCFFRYLYSMCFPVPDGGFQNIPRYGTQTKKDRDCRFAGSSLRFSTACNRFHSKRQPERVRSIAVPRNHPNALFVVLPSG